MQPDVDRLVLAAEKLTGTWPSQPPPIPEVAVVARHGKAVVPLLLALLSDDPNAERDLKRWKVQHQVSLVLGRIYSESQQCGYCDGDPPERIGRVREGSLRVMAEMQALRPGSGSIVPRRRRCSGGSSRSARRWCCQRSRCIAELQAWFTHDDRHLRGNVAHPGSHVGQSGIDQRNPMVPVVGHTAIIVPNFGHAPWRSLETVGVDEYLGSFEWRACLGVERRRRVRLVLW